MSTIFLHCKSKYSFTLLFDMSSPQSQTISPPNIPKKNGGFFSFDFISINACTFDGIEDDKDAIRILKYHMMDIFFLNTMKEEMMEKVNLEKRASLLSLEMIFSLAEQIQKEAIDLDGLIKEHDVLLRACLKLKSKTVHAIAFKKK